MAVRKDLSSTTRLFVWAQENHYRPIYLLKLLTSFQCGFYLSFYKVFEGYNVFWARHLFGRVLIVLVSFRNKHVVWARYTQFILKWFSLSVFASSTWWWFQVGFANVDLALCKTDNSAVWSVDWYLVYITLSFYVLCI